ncbi:MAG: DNA-binding response regulator, partial [Muribaculaceae bacterium]|nr:DNA-binding response regulator [Muribaculaceae bacterium]
MSTLRCYIITDDDATSQLMKQYIDRTPMLECSGVFTSAREAFPGIAASGADVVIASADMPQLGGLELSRLLPSGCRLVLLAADPGNAADVY